MSHGFRTALTRTGTILQGPWREPKQMLAEQEYGGHLSIHDDETAEQLGFKAGTVKCAVVLNHATLKDSYADYPKD